MVKRNEKLIAIARIVADTPEAKIVTEDTIANAHYDGEAEGVEMVLQALGDRLNVRDWRRYESDGGLKEAASAEIDAILQVAGITNDWDGMVTKGAPKHAGDLLAYSRHLVAAVKAEGRTVDEYNAELRDAVRDMEHAIEKAVRGA